MVWGYAKSTRWKMLDHTAHGGVNSYMELFSVKQTPYHFGKRSGGSLKSHPELPVGSAVRYLHGTENRNLATKRDPAPMGHQNGSRGNDAHQRAWQSRFHPEDSSARQVLQVGL